ncbi:MAG: hypothetical protein KH009_09355 [Clostridiales bacterium]|nr:hypothetical protein [Clostridiales bacterium]
MDKLDSKPLFNIVSGITILCIIVGSQWYLCPDIITRIIFTFHIPVLFIISGYFLEIKSTRQTSRVKTVENCGKSRYNDRWADQADRSTVRSAFFYFVPPPCGGTGPKTG